MRPADAGPLRMRFVDLSAPIEPTPASWPDLLRTEIEFADHAQGAAQIKAMFGVGPELLARGEGWAIEDFTRFGTHSSTHVDAPYHYNSVIAGKPAQTIDQLPLDWFFRPVSKLEFSGMYFHGRNLAVLGGLQQGFDVLPGNRWQSVGGNGGWAQLRFPVTERLAFDIYGGQQHDVSADLTSGFISRNQAYFANAQYRLAPNVILSLEGGQVRTKYFLVGPRLNDHYDLGVAYLF